MNQKKGKPKVRAEKASRTDQVTGYPDRVLTEETVKESLREPARAFGRGVDRSPSANRFKLDLPSLRLLPRDKTSEDPLSLQKVDPADPFRLGDRWKPRRVLAALVECVLA